MQVRLLPPEPTYSTLYIDPTFVGHAMADRLVERGVYLPMVLRVPDVAAFLGITERAVRQQIAEGKIPAVKPGRDWLIPRDAWMRRLEEEAERGHPRRRRG